MIVDITRELLGRTIHKTYFNVTSIEYEEHPFFNFMVIKCSSPDHVIHIAYPTIRRLNIS